MNQKLLIPAAALLLALGTTACQKDPETEPRYLIRDELLWDNLDQNAFLAGAYLNDVYSYLPGGFNRIGAGAGIGANTDIGDFLAAGAGDAVPSRLQRPVEYYTNGTVSSVNNPDPYWNSAYAGIRRVNIFLANIDRVPVSATNNVYWKAEVRFIRAMLYFELVKRYGGVPLIGDKVFTLNDDLSLPRNTYADCVNYIVSECDAIKGNLRADASLADADWGRITRGCALALKGRMLLYAASPLFNGGRVNGASDLQGYPSADPSRWQRAYDATQELVALNYYALNAGTVGSATPYSNIFTAKRNKEIILAKQAANSTLLETNNAPIGYSSPATSLGLTSPTQDFVDAFPTNTGLGITATGTNYNATAPYTNRDPRLDATVFYNGMTWLSRPVQTFTGGVDRPGGSAVQTRTGYYLRKFTGNFVTGTTYSNTSHNFPIFRYAEVLLNAAEALNELGRTDEALTRLIAIRTRSGIAPGTNSRYGLPAAGSVSQADARTLIRNERRIELGFEEHRFWDLRRWKTAETVLNGPLYGVQITRSGAGTTASPYTFTYARQQVSTMNWQPRLYYMPLPYDETTKNLNLAQNPGW
ncbi:MAG TPA: RagB/SusD family nutrient uptake outer membrane protein [Hymenobacter sp.]|uniref:RagB/SusD family nutrient uptake outer membrane protein n=1 Tax=Hymenobacter sp. TaxID=1898978 RepID=UPI002D7E6D7F|nr:RagB/SusD family nutrient uptake outer membrane protein [Hymenobacter sp.]HET9503884.1 RagB/SusD family nutrient uptake outer membrane protein [Hymenobacter sp.]